MSIIGTVQLNCSFDMRLKRNAVAGRLPDVRVVALGRKKRRKTNAKNKNWRSVGRRYFVVNTFVNCGIGFEHKTFLVIYLTRMLVIARHMLRSRQMYAVFRRAENQSQMAAPVLPPRLSPYRRDQGNRLYDRLRRTSKVYQHASVVLREEKSLQLGP